MVLIYKDKYEKNHSLFFLSMWGQKLIMRVINMNTTERRGERGKEDRDTKGDNPGCEEVLNHHIDYHHHSE